MRHEVTITCLLVALISIACSERTYNNETLLIQWTGTSTGLIFRVTERPGVMVHTFTRLYVERNGNVDSKHPPVFPIDLNPAHKSSTSGGLPPLVEQKSSELA